MIKLLIIDIDGVMTDGTKFYDTQGNVVMKQFNDKDWTAIKRFRSSGVNVVALSGDRNINEILFQKRNIDFVHARTSEGIRKASFLPELMKRYGVTQDETAYIGDDLFDLDILRAVYVSFCPADAIQTIKNFSDVCLPRAGGQGVLEDLFEVCKRECWIHLDNMEKIEQLDNNEKQ